MLSRPISESIEVLRCTLLEVVEKLDPVSDAPSIAELRRIILRRIAELEIEREREHQIASRTHDSPIVVFADDVIADNAA